MTAHSAVDLVISLLRDAASDRRCAVCGHSLSRATIEPGEITPVRIVARVVCECGAAEVVVASPAETGGRAGVA